MEYRRGRQRERLLDGCPLTAWPMNARTLEAYLRAHIPLSRGMRVRVVELQGARIALSAPLRPNWNHQRTAFGGSIATLGLLAGWSLIHAHLENAGIPHNLVVKCLSVDYSRPITGALTARAELPPTANWNRFLSALKRHNKWSIVIEASLQQDDQPAAQLSATFVALTP